MEHINYMTLPWHDWLPIVFLGLMGLSALIYVVLDGFDLGIGILSPLVKRDDRDLMIASIGPFWDANETWLVLAVGLLLVAFPTAHGAVLGALYLPTTAMLIGLILRGVAFEFRIKGPSKQRAFWDSSFFAGSLIATVSQGYMLGYYILGLPTGWTAFVFASLVALGVTSAYVLIGSCWLVAKSENALQRTALRWAKKSVLGIAATMALISAATPLASERIFNIWFVWPNLMWLMPIPLLAVFITWKLFQVLNTATREINAKDAETAAFVEVVETNQAKLRDQSQCAFDGARCWVPFSLTATLFVLAFIGLAYSFFPFVVPESLTIWEAAASRDSLAIILVGTCITLPMIVGYSIFAYKVFGGKATKLSY